MSPCKKCGSEIFYVKQRLTGTCRYYSHIDPNRQQEVDDTQINSNMYDYIGHTYISKYYWCATCDARGERINE